ncbi:hypothetical protein FHS29_003290 [Saccharothrix tamanrassetensis]|uniref:Uncharacterized protein n=1 Tax=Saccharothrix tamanrassetensis TaxID=1051531 RepID=A0A841CK20_9PSEU|nr:hypothetical protein [Saccharothrix tamanrassetensis]MBB5956704.1 hypothetical protein [Saccharothrix tamanrassetensis]
MIVPTVMSLPFVVLSARVGRRRWVSRREVAWVRAEPALFHHRLTRS